MMNFAKFSTTTLGRFFIISREVSHYAFLAVGFFNKTLLMKILEGIFVMPVAKNRNENILDVNMTLVGKHISSTSFHYMRKAKNC